MSRIVLAMIAVGALAAAAGIMVPASGQSDGDAAPIYGITIPPGYRDWRLISVNHLAGGSVKTGARPVGQRYCDESLSRREAPVSGRRNHCRAALE